MRMNGLAGTASTDSGQDEACFAFRQVIGEANDASIAMLTAFGLVHVDEAGDGYRIKSPTCDATGTPQP